MSEGYNGYTNYETWIVNVELVADLANSWMGEELKFDDVRDLADALESSVEDIFSEEASHLPNRECSLLYYWAQRSLALVDWDDLADNYKDELVRKDEEEAA